MANLQQRITDKFLQSLEEGKELDASAIKELRELFTSGNRPKADDLVKIFTAPADQEVK
jgi:hypothetical protein